MKGRREKKQGSPTPAMVRGMMDEKLEMDCSEVEWNCRHGGVNIMTEKLEQGASRENGCMN